MATKIDEFNFNGGGAAQKYDWDAWLNGDSWQLIKGEDFDVAVSSFRSAAMSAAGRRQVKMRSSVDGDTIVIQAYTPNGNGTSA